MTEKVIQEIRFIETDDGFLVEITGDKERIKKMGFGPFAHKGFGAGRFFGRCRGRGRFRGYGHGYGPPPWAQEWDEPTEEPASPTTEEYS